MIRKMSLIIVVASMQINLNNSINFFFLSFFFGKVLQISKPEELLRHVLLYTIIPFLANLS